MSVAARAETLSVGLLDCLGADGLPVSYAAHQRQYGALPLELSAVELRERISSSGLTGRGGAAFPTAVKLDAVAHARGKPVVVANGAEGEPPSGKDKVLLGYVPHLVLDGVVLAAHAVGARRAIVATTAAMHARVRQALAARGGGSGIEIHAAVVPDTFVAGEETALINSLNGGSALPTFVPPRPFESGVDGAPTVVLNVETLAHVALIARYGAAWFRRNGTADEPGTALVTVSGAVQEPGVYEVELGSPLADLLAQAQADQSAQAHLIGGLFGTWVGGDEAATARLSNADLRRLGASLGARAIVVLPRDACGIVETARIARYLAGQSAGQCGPCVHGLAAIAESLDQLVHRGRRAPDYGLLRRRLAQVAGRGACRHPDGAVGLVSSALRVFPRELERHLQGHRCTGSSRPVVRLP
jgi:NADH:ubiquinone oxidoreductase subunit F (NADH-binding)